MTQKLDKLSSDILDFLTKHEPNRFRWTEICEGLWPSYKFAYKNEKSFRVAVSPKLNALVGSQSVIKEDSLYGTLKSKPIGQKPSNEVKPSRFGFFEWLNKRAERKKQEQREEEKRQLLESIHYRELLAEYGGSEWEVQGKIAKKDRELLKELGSGSE